MAVLVVVGVVAHASARRACAAADHQIFEWQGGDTIEIVASGAKSEGMAPIELARDVRGLKIALTQVDMAGVQDAIVTKGFNLVLEEPAGSLGTRLKVTVDATVVTRPGKYGLSFVASAERIDDKTNAHVALRQSAVLFVMRPAATLEARGDLTIERTFATPVSKSPWRETIADITLKESGNKSNVWGLTVDMSLMGDPKARPNTTFTVIDPQNLRLGPGGDAHLRYAIRGDGFGTTKGTLAIGASETTSTVVIPFEIRNRLDRIWIAIFAIVGSIIGYVARYVVAGALARSASMKQALAFEAVIDLDLADHKDPKLREGLEQIKKELQEAGRGEDPKKIDEAVEVARQKIDEARQVFERRRATALEALLALDTLIGVRGLPSEVNKVLAAARELAAAARGALSEAQPDVAAAEASLTKAQNALEDDASGLGPAIDQWSSEIEAVPAHLAGFVQSLPEWIATPLRSALDSARQQLRERTRTRPFSRQTFEDLLEAQDLLRQGADWLSRGLEDEIRRVRHTTLGIVSEATTKRIDEARTALLTEARESVLTRTFDAVAKLIGILDDTAREAMRGLDQDTGNEVRALIGAHSYAEACRRARQGRPAAEGLTLPAARELIGGAVSDADKPRPQATFQRRAAPPVTVVLPPVEMICLGSSDQ